MPAGALPVTVDSAEIGITRHARAVEGGCAVLDRWARPHAVAARCVSLRDRPRQPLPGPRSPTRPRGQQPHSRRTPRRRPPPAATAGRSRR